MEITQLNTIFFIIHNTITLIPSDWIVENTYDVQTIFTPQGYRNLYSSAYTCIGVP